MKEKIRFLCIFISIIFSSSCVGKSTDVRDVWAVQRCVVNLLPPVYYTLDDQRKILSDDLDKSEIEEFKEKSTPDLSASLQEEVMRLWPNEMAFRRSLGRKIEESASDFSSSLAKNFFMRFKLDSCGTLKEVELTIVTILSDRVSGIFRGNRAYESIVMGPPGRAYLVMMATGAMMNGYPSALKALSGKK